MNITGKIAGIIGMVLGAFGILIAGLNDACTSTNTLMLCGSIVLSSGIIACAISDEGSGK